MKKNITPPPVPPKDDIEYSPGHHPLIHFRSIRKGPKSSFAEITLEATQGDLSSALKRKRSERISLMLESHRGPPTAAVVEDTMSSSEEEEAAASLRQWSDQGVIATAIADPKSNRRRSGVEGTPSPRRPKRGQAYLEQLRAAPRPSVHIPSGETKENEAELTKKAIEQFQILSSNRLVQCTASPSKLEHTVTVPTIEAAFQSAQKDRRRMETAGISGIRCSGAHDHKEFLVKDPNDREGNNRAVQLRVFPAPPKKATANRETESVLLWCQSMEKLRHDDRVRLLKEAADSNAAEAIIAQWLVPPRKRAFVRRDTGVSSSDASTAAATTTTTPVKKPRGAAPVRRSASFARSNTAQTARGPTVPTGPFYTVSGKVNLLHHSDAYQNIVAEAASTPFAPLILRYRVLVCLWFEFCHKEPSSAYCAIGSVGNTPSKFHKFFMHAFRGIFVTEKDREEFYTLFNNQRLEQMSFGHFFFQLHLATTTLEAGESGGWALSSHVEEASYRTFTKKWQIAEVEDDEGPSFEYTRGASFLNCSALQQAFGQKRRSAECAGITPPSLAQYWFSSAGAVLRRCHAVTALHVDSLVTTVLSIIGPPPESSSDATPSPVAMPPTKQHAPPSSARRGGAKGTSAAASLDLTAMHYMLRQDLAAFRTAFGSTSVLTIDEAVQLLQDTTQFLGPLLLNSAAQDAIADLDALAEYALCKAVDEERRIQSMMGS